MSDNRDSALFLATINAVLTGGPKDFPDAQRQQSVSHDQEKVKVPHRGGYEHFERAGHDSFIDGAAAGIVFRWTMRTAIAE